MKKIITISILLFSVFSCTDDFTEINKNPNGIATDQLFAKYFVTKPEVNLFAPNRYPYWRGNLIHADRYAGYFSFGHNGSWWNDGLAYNYSSSYTDATWNYYAQYYSQIYNLLEVTKQGGSLENEGIHAVGLILKSIYFQLYTDTFGEIPFSETGNLDIQQPKFDTMIDIYKGIISDLDKAVNLIGDKVSSGEGEQELKDNDIIYKGDLQKWKRLANTLKLRMALRANGAAGDDFTTSIIQQALSSELLEGNQDDAVLKKDTEISQWANSAYGDVWHNFGGRGSKWTVGKVLINILKGNNDPRLSKYANPALGGEMVFKKSADMSESEHNQRFNFMTDLLDEAGTTYTTSVNTDGDKVITMPENTEYVGFPSRINAFQKPYAKYEMFSTPADKIIAPKNSEGPVTPEIVMLAAEANFLKAEAIVKGLVTGNANEEYQKGLRSIMTFWEVEESDINTFLTSSSMGTLTGVDDLKKITIQRWIGQYTEGYEGWAIVRDSGFPEELAGGVNNQTFYSLGDLNGAYPQRMRYGAAAYSLNGIQLESAIGRQGPDEQGTKLWWAKQN